jgi:DNA-binding IclR family transcriptional regulator
VYEKVAWALEETPAEGDGTGIEEIALKENLPHTQVHVALQFMDERGLVDRRHRRNYPATPAVHLDAMLEWHALREKPA